MIEDGVRLRHTPGHTPGHSSVLLGGGRDEEAIITGDLLHHPFQIAEPHRSSSACRDPALAARTRREFVERYADADTLVLGSHFAPPTATRSAEIGGLPPTDSGASNSGSVTISALPSRAGSRSCPALPWAKPGAISPSRRGP